MAFDVSSRRLRGEWRGGRRLASSRPRSRASLRNAGDTQGIPAEVRLLVAVGKKSGHRTVCGRSG
jgi:hypothetical protein